ncbi:SpoIIE family protein phosphatase [Streptomyces sulfonofaciens]|uniref:SpoIIE family protein phosphatase n=1 Tax=Streptomyces sulfonofaciens TaxID=68272 RepID=UPI001675FE05|nr:SpoIIE family protein phosphatase [Streptomyces sulfonofaciens]
MRPQARARPEAGLTVDAHGVITDWSAEAERLFGYAPSDVLGRAAAALLAHPSDALRPAGPDGWGPDRETVEDAAAPLRVRCRDGHWEACSLRIRPTLNGPGAGARWSVTLTPVVRAGRELDGAVLEALFTQSPIGLCLFDDDLRLRRYNSAAEGMKGIFTPRSLGRRARDVWAASNADELEELLTKVRDTGVPLLGFDKHGYPPGDPDHEHYFATSAFRLEDSSGRVGVAVTGVDITARRRAEQRFALLAEASGRIGTTLDVVRTAQELTEVVVPGFCDAAVVDMLDPVLRGDEPDADAARASLRRAGVTVNQALGVEVGDPHLDLGTTSSIPPSDARCLATMDPVLRRVVEPDSSGLGLSGDLGTGNGLFGLIVPLRARGSTLGLATFYRFGTPRTFEEGDFVTAREVTSRAAVCIDNARRYTREHVVARALRRQLLPSRFPPQGAMEIAHSVVTEGTSGDWFDAIPLPGARLALVVGTVVGSGVYAAAAMGRLRAAIHTLAELDLGPDEVLARVDDLVTHITEERGEVLGVRPRPAPGSVAGATCAYIVYDPVTGHLSVASAGHPVPLITYPDGTVEPADLPSGVALGTGDSPFGTADMGLPPHSGIALYTPGLLAGAGAGAGIEDEGTTAGLEELKERLVASRDDPVEDACRATADALLHRGSRHDAVLLLARTHVFDEDQVVTWDLPSDPAVVATVRALVERQLSAWSLDGKVFPTQLVASELVTNAIRHAEGPIKLRLLRDQMLTCEVADGSAAAPRMRHARAGDEDGRGLFLTAQVTQRWGTRYLETGKIIWAEQPLDAESGLGDLGASGLADLDV